ncbi:damage-control phosphatase ARMT1 family protein [Methanospirillum stamsii]|uniref:Damage-control phosphatase ARMT1-like metal-binding domain-containing protein n=1 Tax=Methanospirillum stamsii TaxID=1277351 RepID=A0A2V2MZ98_9EURY|nr:ARMT1-like domain-containing protein [Methanospirillum stamsii]PWR70736.1 hypothetical protein DLD82_14645 [Methanospirillum stamsii]
MKHDPRCFECLFSRVDLEIKLAETETRKKEEIYDHAKEIIRFLESTPWTHPMIASALHRAMYQRLGVSDPFYALKQASEEVSLTIIDTVLSDLTNFREFVLASVIGNMFDYGVKGHEVSDDFVSFFNTEFASGLAIDDTERILPLCNDVVYFTDNCGEIVFDRALIKWLKDQGSKVTLVVREKPILNDATIEDAKRINLDSIADTILTTGAGVELGIRFDLMPDEVMKAIDTCSIIISKGMANYESLREENGLVPVAYLLCAKCEPIAEELGVNRGDKIALLRNH